ncbi:hypothetical protein LTS18_008611, partial [Coniosporium uncinatum]
WEPRPTAPVSIRLISMGRVLEDNAKLSECRFSTESANVLHLSVKPQDIVDEEENAKTGKGSARGDGERTAG